MNADSETALRALHEVATEIRDYDDPVAVCERTVEAAERILAFDHCGVSLERDGGLVLVASSAALDSADFDPIPVGEGLAGRAFETGESLLMNDASASDLVEEHDRFEVALTVPLGNHGVFQAIKERAEPFDADDRDLGELLCSHAGGALDRIERERQLRTHNRALAESTRRTQRVQAVTESLIEADSREAVAERIVAAASEVFTAPLSGVHLRTGAAPVLEGVAATDAVETAFGEVPDYVCDGGSVHETVWEVYEAGEPMVVRDTESDDRVTLTDSPVRSFVVHPLGDHGVYILSSRETEGFDGTDLALTELLSSTATAAMDKLCDRRELERYRTAVETVPDGVFMIDETGEILQVNDAWAELVGYPPEELVGESFQRLVDEGDIDTEIVETYLQTVRRLLSDTSDQQRASFVTEFTPAGSEESRTFEIHLQLLPFEESFRGVAGVVRDVSERVERRRALERENERLDEFASIVSHDLRNPLSVARGSLSLAAETGDSTAFERCDRALDRMDELIEDLLELSRAGETASEEATVDLAAVATRSWGLVDSPAAELRVERTATIRADESRLAQLLENLFRNGVEHASTSGPSRARTDAAEVGRSSVDENGTDPEPGPAGTVTIQVGTLPSGFYVADDGPGIPPEERESVFERGVSSTDSGTGFGLAIVERIADAHGWTVEATESEAGGARFEITGVEFVDQ